MNLNALVEQLKKDEGFSPVSFWDRDQFTFGYGCKAPGPGAVIQEHIALALLSIRAKAAADDFYDIFAGCVMSERRELALQNMAFNLGETKLRKFKNMIAAVRRGDWALAAAQAKASLWYRQLSIPSNEKEERSERIVREILEG